MDLGTMTVSLRADLTGLDAGLRRAQELVSDAAAALAAQEQRFRAAGSAARDYGDGMSRWMAAGTEAVAALGQSAQGLSQGWRGAWEAMDGAADAALRRITRRFGSAVAEMIVDGRGLRDFWRALWRDLLEIAVQRLLQMVLRTRGAAGEMRDALSGIGGGLFGGLGGIIGGLLGGVLGGVGSVLGKIGDFFGFDNPRNDAWARRQGFDFAKHFRAGVAQAMALPMRMPRNVTSAPAAGLLNAIAPAGASRSSRAANLTFEPGAVQIHAQVLDERAVRDAGGLIADEVCRRLGWTEKRSGY
jgi:hypothetical protein